MITRRPRPVTSGAVAATTLAALLALWHPAAGQTLARITDIQADADAQQLTLLVDAGGFDPTLSLEALPGDRFRIVIEGDDVQFDAALRARAQALQAQIRQTFSDVEGVRLEENASGASPASPAHIRMILETRARRLPQIAENAGNRITIRLITPSDVLTPATPALESSSAPPMANTLVEMPAPQGPPDPTTAAAPAQAPAVTPSPARLSDGASWPSPAFSLNAYFAPPASSEADPVPADLRQAWRQRQAGDLSAALQTLTTYRQKTPKDPVAAYLHAETALDAGRRDEAIALLQTLTTQSPAFCAAWVALIRETLDIGGAAAMTQAATNLRQALEYWPDHAELVYLEGVRAAIAGQTAQAANAFSRTLTLAPWHERAAYRLAVCELRQNRPQAAIQALTMALRLNPDDIAAQKALAYVYQISGRPSEALRQNRQALKPDSLINYAGLLMTTAPRDAAGKLPEQARQQAALLYRAADLLLSDGDEMRLPLAQAFADAGFQDDAARIYENFARQLQTRLTSAPPDRPEAIARLKTLLGEATAALAALKPPPAKNVAPPAASNKARG